MGSVRAFAQAHKRAENRIIARAYPVWLKIARRILKAERAGQYEPVDISDFSHAIEDGMLSAYFYGRIDAFADLVRKLKRGAREAVKLAEVGDFQSVWEKLMRYDRPIIRRLLAGMVKDSELRGLIEHFRPSPEVLAFFDDYTVRLAHVTEQDFLQAVTKWVRHTITEGMSEDEAAEYLEKRIKIFSKARIRAIARTEATRGYNIGRLQESLSSDIVVGYQFDAVLDDKTTDICRERDGKFIPKDERETLLANTPPLHVNCRSRLVEVTRYDEIPNKLLDPTSLPAPMQRPYDLATLKRIFG